jgi:2-dehydropantoate 2-reductase
MRFIIYGAGAVGGVVGARLFENGHDVALIARGRHGEAIATNGLRIESADHVATLPIPVVDHPSGLAFAEGDHVLLGMKTQDSSAALEALAELALPSTPIVCLQNGVENERMALRRFANVYGICVMCPTAHLEPGVVQANSTPVTGILDIGRYPGGVDDTATAVASALSASTFTSMARPDILRWKYGKLLLNLGNAVEAVCGPEARRGEIIGRVRAEGIACLRAAGIDIVSDEEEADRRRGQLQRKPIDGARRGGGSSWQSLQRQAGSVESDYLNGEIVLLGRLRGVPTPVNELLQRLARNLAREGKAPGSIPADDFLALLDEPMDEPMDEPTARP